jgi:hypothetical protein
MALEIRDPDEARRHILTGWWLSRIAAPSSETTPSVLTWLLALASEGHAVPPVAFLADVGSLIFGAGEAPPPIPSRELPGVEPGLLRRYEDYCLGKLYSDLAFERGGDAVLRYAEDDRGRGLCYLVERLLLQTGFEGILLNPAAIRSLQQLPADEVLRQSWQALAEDGLSAAAVQQFEALIGVVKSAGDLLAPADVFELERGTALAEFGQRLALRQVLRAAEQLAEGLPRQRPRTASKRREVATRLLTEDAYPVGGFSSISTKGTIESLLHSQLVYLERGQRPDLFDIKFVRDELLYYSRDENQFLRRRTTLLVVLAPDLVAARTKDASLPYQRIVLALGLLLALTQKLREWLSDEALELHFVLPESGGQRPLEDEQSLLALLVADQIELGTARVESLPLEKLPRIIAAHSRRSLVRCVVAAATEAPLPTEGASPLRLLLATPQPHLEEEGAAPYWSEEPGIAAWQDALQVVLERLL